MKVWVFVALDVELEVAATMNIIKCVVPISGGKDSQCCLKLALQKFDTSEIIGVFCDTKKPPEGGYLHPISFLWFGQYVYSHP